jgi:succinate dehydrogenase cytochrome b556 subunit
MSRPLSPHIFIYKPQISSLFSVMHRASGVILSLAILFIPLFLELFSFCLSYYPFYIFATALETFAS